MPDRYQLRLDTRNTYILNPFEHPVGLRLAYGDFSVSHLRIIAHPGVNILQWCGKVFFEYLPDLEVHIWGLDEGYTFIRTPLTRIKEFFIIAQKGTPPTLETQLVANIISNQPGLPTIDRLAPALERKGYPAALIRRVLLPITLLNPIFPRGQEVLRPCWPCRLEVMNNDYINY